MKYPFRRGFLPIIIAIIVAGGAIITMFLSFSAHVPDAARPPSAPSPSPALPRVLSPTPLPRASDVSPLPISASPTARPSVDNSIVALVNGDVIRRQEIQEIAEIDHVMADLVGPRSSRDSLSRVVNHVLVLQAARQAGFVLSDEEIDAALAVFLRRYQLTLDDLRAALAARNITMTEFRRYFADLLTVSRFTAKQAQAMGLTTDMYIARLQRAAHISLGPAASTLFESPIPAVQATPTPSSTPVSMSSVPTETPRPPIQPTEPAITRGLSPGMITPDFALPTLDGGSFSAQDLIGRPTVLSFFTTWCPYCRRQTPILVAASEEYGHQVQFIGIDLREKADLVRAYADKYGIRYPILLDREGTVSAAYRVTGVPVTYFLDAQGRMVARHIGALSEAKLRGYLRKITR